MYCLRLFYKNYIVYCYYCGVFTEKYVRTNFILIGCCVSELHGHLWPEDILQELHCLSNCLHAYSVVVKDFYRYAKFHL